MTMLKLAITVLLLLSSPALAEIKYWPAPGTRCPDKEQALGKICPGDKVEVVGKLVVFQKATRGVVSGESPFIPTWFVDLSGLMPDQIADLRNQCEPDLPCVGHFKMTYLHSGPDGFEATLDGYR